MYSRSGIERFLLALLLLSSQPGAVLADEDIWKSGLNLYVRLTEQDDAENGRPPPNQHPVNLAPAAITNSLMDIRVWDKHWFKKDEIEEVFAPEQARMLGQQLAIALGKASPTQDIVFAVSRTDTKFFAMKDISYTAGRAFYANGHLNIIIGDFMRLPDKFQERASGGAGITEIKYYFRHGRRDDPSDFESAVMTGEGVDVYTEGGQRRSDWLVIDVDRASAAYLAQQKADEPGAATVNDEALRQEAARLAQERREMRLEMARLRKEVGGGGQSGAATPALPVEARLKTLDELHGKRLISDEEYERKRQEILNDL